MTSGGATFEVVSPEFPCGSAWLANCLFELGVPAWHLWGFDTRGEWTEQEAHVFRYTAAQLPWRQTLASLTSGREFRFRQDLAARFSHECPWQIALGRRIVLMVRDPRDALYSEWQRHRRNLALPESVSFPAFLTQPFFGGPIAMADMLWLHMKSWLVYRNALPARVYLLRFEDWKRAPVDQLRRVCEWIGIHNETDALQRAIAASDVRKLRSIESVLAAENPKLPLYNRRGQAEEWRTAWNVEWLRCLGRQWHPVIEALAYAPLPPQDQRPQPFDLRQVLHWRGLTDPARNRIWCDLLAS